MRAYVFSDGALAKHAGRFAWLSIDTEKDQNAAFLARYPITVWPTLMVIDPDTETALVRWPGSAEVTKLEELFDEGERARAHEQARLDREQQVEKDVLGALVAHELERCAREAMAEGPTLHGGTRFANVVGAGLACALDGGEAAWRGEAVAKLEPLVTEAVALPGLLADDRSGLFEGLVEAREQAGDDPAKKALALRWLAFLEAEAAKAPTAEARAAFDPHRVVAAMKAGDPARAIPALQQSERDLPGDYNAPARLAQLYLALDRHDEALAAIDRALARVYGPRRQRLLKLKDKIVAARPAKSLDVK